MSEGLIERLRRKEIYRPNEWQLRNPDGPEAADALEKALKVFGHVEIETREEDGRTWLTLYGLDTVGLPAGEDADRLRRLGKDVRTALSSIQGPTK